jgi:hypothetical protein
MSYYYWLIVDNTADLEALISILFPVRISTHRVGNTKLSVLVESPVAYTVFNHGNSLLDFCKKIGSYSINWINTALLINGVQVGGHEDEASFIRFVDLYSRTYAQQYITAF